MSSLTACVLVVAVGARKFGNTKVGMGLESNQKKSLGRYAKEKLASYKSAYEANRHTNINTFL